MTVLSAEALLRLAAAEMRAELAQSYKRIADAIAEEDRDPVTLRRPTRGKSRQVHTALLAEIKRLNTQSV